MKKINLLNSEGPLKKKKKSDTGFLNVIDEFGKNVAIWNNIQFVEFIGILLNFQKTGNVLLKNYTHF